jgi:hypothetical protein
LIIFEHKISSIDDYKDITVYWIKEAGWGVSLGNYIFLDRTYNSKTVEHEYGHSRQSRLLGPAYLFVIGIPSITMNILSRLLKGRFADNYYKRWPESWADKLGGVTR